jgi:hypothetical protein
MKHVLDLVCAALQQELQAYQSNLAGIFSARMCTFVCRYQQNMTLSTYAHATVVDTLAPPSGIRSYVILVLAYFTTLAM